MRQQAQDSEEVISNLNKRISHAEECNRQESEKNFKAVQDKLQREDSADVAKENEQISHRPSGQMWHDRNRQPLSETSRRMIHLHLSE
jgi:hypothetical protein